MFNEGGNRICSPELLAQIAEVIDSAVLITKFGGLSQFDHRIIYTNPAFTRLTGYKSSEIIGRSPDILCDARTSGDKILEFYSKAKSGGGRFSLELDSFDRMGAELPLKLDVTPVIDDSQNTNYYILTLKAVEKQEAETQPVASSQQPTAAFDERYYMSPNNDQNPNSPIRETAAQVNKGYVHAHLRDEFIAHAETKRSEAAYAEAGVKIPAELSTDESIADYCKTQFLANMSHDLRTPLNAIIGFSEVIKDQLFGPIENPRYISYANDIFKSGQELFSTITEILELSEIHPDSHIGENERMNICELVESVIDVLSPKAFSSDVKIFKTLEARDLNVIGDRRKIKQAVAGIISNSITHSSKGSKIDISLSLNEKGDLRFVVFAKSANISQAKAGLRGTATKRSESEYPEISLAKRFIEAHGGKLTIFNSASGGSEIAVILPSSRVEIETEKKTLLKVIS